MKVLLTYDYMVSDEKVFKLPYWFEFLFKLLKSMGVEIELFSKQEFGYSQGYFFSLCNIPVNISLKEPFFPLVYEDLTPQSIEYVLSFLRGYDVVITYEASTLFRKVLEDNSIRYIDIWLSPIRFYKDLMFSFYSNDPVIRASLSKYKVDEKKLYREAKVINDQFKYFIKVKENFSLERNSALIIGQLSRDKSVMKERKFLTLLDFYEDIKKLSKKYTKLYLLRHPLMRLEEFKTIVEGFSDIKNIEWLEGVNTYFLLTREEIKSCVGISSSVLTEARYFGKEVIFLYKPVIDENYVNIYEHYYSSSFWANILGLDHCDDFLF